MTLEIAETNVTTGEFIQRKMTSEEIAKDADHIAIIAEQEKNALLLESAKQFAKEAAQAKLAALGLSVDDLKALGL